MAAINTIPPELVREIFSHLPIEDFENFAQISKYIYTVTAPLLAEHRVRCRKYHDLETYQSADGQIGRLEWLELLLTDPSIGRYVRSINLLVQSDESDESDDNVVERQPYEFTDKDTRIISQLAGKAGIIESGCMNASSSYFDPSDWLDQAAFSQEPLLLGLLLLGFPNALSLTVEAGCMESGKEFDFYGVLWKITSLPSNALDKVTKVLLRPSADDWHSIVDVQSYCFLPSVRSLSAPDLFPYSPEQDCYFSAERLVKFNSTEPNSTLTQLSLWNCAATPESLFDFLQSFTCLQTFKYSYADNATSFTPVPQFNPFMIRSGLMSRSATTLRTIVLLAHPNDLEPPFIGSLRRFPALTDLRTTYSSLLGMDDFCLELGPNLPSSLRRLVLDGQRCPQFYDPVDAVDAAVKSAMNAKEREGVRPLAPSENLEELIFTGYEGFRDGVDKELTLRRAKEESLVVKFVKVDELDGTALANPHSSFDDSEY